MKITPTQATFIGCAAILLWSVDAVITVSLGRLPVFQILAFAWLSCFFLYAIIISVRQDWSKVNQKILIWLIGALGVCGSHLALVWALRLAPPEQVSTLSALWPIFVILLGGWILHREHIWFSVCAAVIGFIGVWLVITDGNGLAGYHFNYSTGYMLAMLSNILWSAYVIMTRKFADISSEMMGMYMGVGGAFALAYHLSFETFVTPNSLEWSLLLVKGMFTLAISYFCWDFAIKRGHFTLLNILSYFAPVFTISLLTLFGYTQSHLSLWVGAILVVIAVILSSGILIKKK